MRQHAHRPAGGWVGGAGVEVATGHPVARLVAMHDVDARREPGEAVDNACGRGGVAGDLGRPGAFNERDAVEVRRACVGEVLAWPDLDVTDGDALAGGDRLAQPSAGGVDAQQLVQRGWLGLGRGQRGRVGVGRDVLCLVRVGRDRLRLGVHGLLGRGRLGVQPPRRQPQRQHGQPDKQRIF